MEIHTNQQHAIRYKRHHAGQRVHVTDRILLHQRAQAFERDFVLATEDAVHRLAQSRNAIVGAPMLMTNHVNDVTDQTDAHVVPVNER